MNTEHNFTTGNIAGGLIKFALPLLLANVLMAGYNLIDMLVVGRYCGSAGVAAVGNASMICFIISSIGLGITIGGTVLIARARGGGDKAGEHRITGALFTVTAIASLPVSLMGWYFSRTVFIWMGVPVESLSAACDYISIISAGTLPVFGYNAVCAFFRGVGDSLRPLLIITVAAVMNVLLDFYFTGYCGYGVAGVAFATVLAQLAALFIGLNCMKKRGFLSGLSWRDFLPAPDIVLGLLKIGIPGALQMTVVNLAFLLVTGMFNHYGVAAAAAAGIGLKVSTLAGMPSWALGQAVTTAAAHVARELRKTGSTMTAHTLVLLLNEVVKFRNDNWQYSPERRGPCSAVRGAYNAYANNGKQADADLIAESFTKFNGDMAYN